MDIELALFIGLLCGGGTIFMLWRIIAAFNSGSIWLRGQNVRRREEPFWFWTYMMTYLLMTGAMLYSVGVALAG